MATFQLGAAEYERVVVTVHRFERAPCGDYHDDNWVDATIDVHAGAFSGRFSASLMTEDFVSFRDELHRLFRELRGEATFTTLEQQLSIQVVGNGLGVLVVSGEARERPGTGSRLAFQFEIDQTQLPGTLLGLDEVCRLFPVRAS